METNEERTKNDETEKSNKSKPLYGDEEEKDEYYVDPNLIKERDANLSEEEKEELKAKAETFKNEGNRLFREGDYYNATSTYTEGLQACPLDYDKERAILFANRAAAKARILTDKKSAIIDCTKAIELDSNYVRAYLRRAHLYEESDKLDEALADYQKVLTFDPAHSESIGAIAKLEPMINERNEKMKTEMLGKLKDLGNMFLKPFGLSTNNFQMTKDEKTGGYSINFNQGSR